MQPRLAAVPLAALFHLATPDTSTSSNTVSSRRLSGIDLARVLISSAMDNRYAAPQRLARQLRFADGLATRLAVYRLSYPRLIETLPEVEEEIRSRSQT
jgi:hypothetical protein